MFIFSCFLKVDPWLIMKIWTSCYKSLMSKIIPKCIGPIYSISWEMARSICMKLLWTKHKIWCGVLNSFLFLWWGHNLWPTIVGFHTCICGWRLAKNSFVLLLQQVVDVATSNNLKHILVDVMVLYGDLTQESITSKVITFVANGVSVFQGVNIGVIV